MEIKSIEKFEGVEAPNKAILAVLMKSVELASLIPASWGNYANLEFRRITMATAVNTVNALLAASSAKCTLAAPPADIDMVPDGSGDLIYRCQHPTAHSWDLEGHKL